MGEDFLADKFISIGEKVSAVTASPETLLQTLALFPHVLVSFILASQVQVDLFQNTLTFNSLWTSHVKFMTFCGLGCEI